jgi:hypothetical protein
MLDTRALTESQRLNGFWGYQSTIRATIINRRICRESQWLNAVRLNQLNAFWLNQPTLRATQRKKILWGCACARQFCWQMLTHDVNRRAVETSERYADGLATKEEAQLAWRALLWEPVMYFEWPIDSVSGFVNYRRAWGADGMEMRRLSFPQMRDHQTRERDWCVVVRELYANPFRPVTFDPAWLTWHDGTVGNMARAIYDEREFGRLPVLADALEDAGCAATELLAHFRGPNEHYLGCWALDLLLGKE